MDNKEYHVCHSCQLGGFQNCSEFDNCGAEKTYPKELRIMLENDYNNKVLLSITVEKAFDMGKKYGK